MYPSIDGAVPTLTNGSLQRMAFTRMVSVMLPEPTATRNSVSGWMDNSTSPQARSSGSITPSRAMTQRITENPSLSSASAIALPASGQVLLSATSTQRVPSPRFLMYAGAFFTMPAPT